MATPNLGSLKALSDMRQKQAKYQKMLDEVRVTGSSKNGKVTVIVSGSQKVVSITIDPALVKFVYENFISMDKEDTMMNRAILEAIDDALSRLQIEIVKKMQESGSMGELMEMFQGLAGN
jgi:DNA-binding protein YbaB